MEQQGISNYRFCDGIVHDQPYTGIARAYKSIIKKAKDDNEAICCIAEDDIIFSDNNSWRYFMDNLPVDFDIYLASVYWSDDIVDDTVKEFSGLTLSVFHSRFYDTFLSTGEANHIDRQMKLHNGIYKVCQPFCAYQIDGYSDNAGKVTSYNETYLKGVQFYLSNP